MTSKSTKVLVAAGEIVTRAGKKHKQGATVALPDVEARDLIRAGLVRLADPAAAETPESASAGSEPTAEPASEPARTEGKK